ncbi:hypothetical protein PVAP13_9NG382119 [Panicum virgatum]|uniref:Alpha-1,2-Mannosidase n=1 Tax=Panicum virgatum TaxID=38727 RepID=A0A8T0MN84_PANVG|nr:hypothetical protein PVAP13_9NG382119 [Panicum virgatum]
MWILVLILLCMLCGAPVSLRRWRACRPASTSARRAPSPASRCRALAGRAGCSARRPSSRAPTSSPPGSSLLLRLRLRASRLPTPSTPGHGGCQALDPATVDPNPVPRAHSQAVWCGSLFVAAATRASGRGGGSPPPPPPPPPPPSPLTPSIGLQGQRKLGKVRILPPPRQLNPSAIDRPSEWITRIEEPICREMDELACFASGMLALGASGYGPEKSEQIMNLAKELARTCYNFYQTTPMKLSGENYFSHAGQVVWQPAFFLLPQRCSL